jgi:hypothetical protein
MDSAARQSDGIAQKPVTALLIVDLDKHIGNARAWRDTFGEQLPDLEIRISPDAGNLADIEYLAFMHPDFDSLPVFPNLKAMFSRSAGVESFYEGNRGHLLRAHLCHDATRGHAGECPPRQACGRRGPDQGARFATVVVRRVRRVVA